MEKRISYSQFQSVKSVAKACDPLIVKRDKIKAKLAALTQEYDAYNMQITSLEAGIKAIIGFRVEELVQKVVESGIDANGQPKKTTKYLPTNIVSYDEDKKQYVITVPDEPSSNPSPESAESDAAPSPVAAFPVEESQASGQPQAPTPDADSFPSVSEKESEQQSFIND